MPFVIVLIITSNGSVKKHFLVGKSRFFVDNSVQKVWVTLPYAGLPDQILANGDNVPGAHRDQEITRPAVLL